MLFLLTLRLDFKWLFAVQLLILFFVVYALLFFLFIYMLNKKIKHGPYHESDTEQRPQTEEIAQIITRNSNPQN